MNKLLHKQHSDVPVAQYLARLQVTTKVPVIIRVLGVVKLVGPDFLRESKYSSTDFIFYS